MFGSDWPYVPEVVVSDTAETLTATLPDEQRRGAVERGNALALFPRLA
jgi:hypothetical protein